MNPLLYRFILGRAWALLGMIFLAGCAHPPVAFTLLAAEVEGPSDRPIPPIRPALNADLPQDLRQIILNQLDEPGRPVVIGQSVLGADLLAYQFGSGPTAVVLVGGIHGGFEANTVLLMERFIEALQESAAIVPEEVSLYVIPVMNPDGYTKRGPQGRINANRVDLNRNWGCNWDKSSGFYRNAFYRAGLRAFSEPESRSVRNFVDYIDGKIVIFYHSHGGFIFYGDCNGDDGSLELARAVSQATEYPIWNPAYSLGDPNQPTITGDATDYFDQIDVQAIGIELPFFTESEIDWDVSYLGLLEIMDYAAALYAE